MTATPRGVRAAQRCAAPADRANAALPAPLDAAEREQFVALLTRVHEG